MDDEEYYALERKHTYTTVKKQKISKVWQGKEDEEMLREKQSDFSCKKDSTGQDNEEEP